MVRPRATPAARRRRKHADRRPAGRAGLRPGRCSGAFCPVLPSITSSTSCGAVASAFCTTRLIFFSSSIRCSCVGRRPAVSTSTTSLPRARPALTASKLTAAGSPPCWLMISTRLRSAQTASCSRAAARKVSAAASSTLAPEVARCLVSLPMEVVLPAPLTPTVRITKGRAPVSTLSGCATGSIRASRSARKARSSSPASANSRLCMRWRKPSTSKVLADTPTSALSRQVSISSSRSSSRRGLRTNNDDNPRANPLFRRRSRQPALPGAASGPVSSAMARAASPASAASGAIVAGVAAGSAPAGAGCGFFFQKLSMETRGMSQNARMVASRQLPAPEVGVAA
jgi:hypothetical protein